MKEPRRESEEEDNEEEILEDNNPQKNFELLYKRIKRERGTIIPPHVLAQYPSKPLSFSVVASPSFSPSFSPSPSLSSPISSTQSSTSSATVPHSPLSLSSPTNVTFHDETWQYRHSVPYPNLTPSPSSPPSPPFLPSSPSPPSTSSQHHKENTISRPISPTLSLPSLSKTTFYQPQPFLARSHPPTKTKSDSNANNNNSNKSHSNSQTDFHSNSNNYTNYDQRLNSQQYQRTQNHTVPSLSSPSSESRFRMDPTFSPEPKCHITDFVVSLFEHDPGEKELDAISIKGFRTKSFQLFATRCWATCVRTDAIYTSTRTQAVLDILQTLRHPNLATPAAHFPQGRYYFAVYPIYTNVGCQLGELTRHDVEKLRTGLQTLHKVGLRHGDVDLHSVMRDEEGTPLWAFCERALLEREMHASYDLNEFEKNIARPVMDEERESKTKDSSMEWYTEDETKNQERHY